MKKNLNTLENFKPVLGKRKDKNKTRLGIIENFASFEKASLKSYSQEEITGKQIDAMKTREYLAIFKDGLNANIGEIKIVDAYNKAYAIYEREIKDYEKMGSKTKIEIIENRLNTTLDYIASCYSEGLDLTISKNMFIKYLGKASGYKKNQKLLNTSEPLDRESNGKTAIDRLNDKFIYEILVEDLDKKTFEFLENYLVNKGKDQKQAVAIYRLKNKLKNKYSYLID